MWKTAFEKFQPYLFKFLKAFFHKFYLLHSWILYPIWYLQEILILVKLWQPTSMAGKIKFFMGPFLKLLWANVPQLAQEFNQLIRKTNNGRIMVILLTVKSNYFVYFQVFSKILELSAWWQSTLLEPMQRPKKY